MNNCEKYIQETLKLNGLSLKQIYKDSLVVVEEIKKDIKKPFNFGQGDNKKKTIYQGVFLRGCDELEKQLFQIYKYFTKHTPSAQSVLLCNKETTSEELIAFLYRSILCESNSCFILGGVELLEFDKKTILLELLNDLFVENHEQMKSFLIILYTNNNSDIYKSLFLLKYKQILENLPKDIEKLKLEDSNVEIISSDRTGVGKSTQIKLDIEKRNKKYIYFPIGGSFSRRDIIKRLQNLEIPNGSALHLDLHNTEETELMTEFLFSILITKLYGQNEDIFYLSKDIEIKIEIPNCFINFKKKFPILTLFASKELSIKELEKYPLIVPKEVYSNIQIVANYLKALKENTLDDQDLFIDTITPEIFLVKEEYLHTIKANSLSQKECQDLIFTEIKKTIPEPNYYQIKSFIDILATQFKKFNQSFYLNTNVFEEFNIDKNLRTFIIESFIKITKYFTKGAFNEILSSQEIYQKQFFGIYDENLDLDSAMKNLADNAEKDHEVVSFDKIDPSLLFFHEGNGEGFSIITKKTQGDDEYEQLLNFMNCQARGQDNYEIPNYKEYKPEQFLEKLRVILDIKNPIDEEEKRKKPEYFKDKKTMKEIAGSYVFTADNFVKMVLILLRIRANIPVIMMGETGCGKTSLIRKLSEFINNGSTDKMKILNIHAGVNDNDIIKYLEEHVIKEAKELEEEEAVVQMLQFEQGYNYFPKKLWVFLDEINTCKSMGLISELMCKNSYQGKPLPSNIVFIAACNPYRQGTKNNALKAGLDLNKANKEMKNLNQKEIEKMKKSMNSTLVYTVNPLPHSLLNFVFDFGHLTDEDEIKYIESIILEPIHKYFYENNENPNENDLKKIHKFAKDMIVCAQNFIREKNDVSSVSLREIRRFNIFYEFFIKYLKDKKEMSNNDSLENKQFWSKDPFYKNLDSFSLQIYSIILSVFVCYYLRITDTKIRDELKIKLNEILNKFDERFKEADFLNVPEKEESYVVENITLEKGIAKNRALKDNIFSLFVTINNKVPIFIVGKPGCSKSLSVQLINKAMKGNSSKSPLFKKLPKIILNSYQGSMGSTSEGVEKVFKIARNKIKNLKDEDKKNNISMIFFDEMGLAEHSPNNPLKVIHAELEYDLNEGDKKVAFVGISNWALDASKMNRGIFLSIPDPGPNDTKETALTIGKSYDDNLAEKYQGFFEYFGEIYFKYKDFLRKYHNQDGKDEFHGNRDFYHLVKIAARMLVDLKADLITDDNLKDISVSSVERNFGGMQFGGNSSTSLEVVKKLLKEKFIKLEISKDYPVLDRIEENIKDSQSRYLLVISKSSISIFLLSSILLNLNKQYSFYIGSQFQNDLQSEEYTLKILNKIQLHMEQGKVLILKNLESVYPALYDLFNQNFHEMGNKKFARIAIGSSTNTFSLVDNNFRCIVNVDEKIIDEEEPPFLNRFEKHIISFEYLLKQDLIKKSIEIHDILMKLISYDKNIYKGINYNLKKIFINSDLEEIQGIIYQAHKNGITNYEDEVISKISLILPQDIILCTKINGFQSAYPEISNKILDSYDKGKHSSLKEFIEVMENRKNVVYTFNNIFDVINGLDDIQSKLLGEIKLDNIKNIKISSFKSENELEKVIDEFLIENKYKLCLIKFTANEGNFLNYIKFLIENKEKEYLLSKNDEKEVNKAFIFIVHLSRVFNYDLDNYEKKNEKEKYEIDKKILKETISHLSGYYQIFIDDLNGKTNFSINNMIKLKGKELFMKCINFNEALRENIYICLSYMKYNFSSKLGDLNEDTYVNKLIDYIENDKQLKNNINICIANQMDKEEDIIFTVFKAENSVNKDDIDMISIIQRYLSDLYLKKLNLIYFKAEQDQFFSSLLSTEEINEMNRKKKENKILNKIEDEDEDDEDVNKNINKKIIDKNEENIIEENINVKEIKKRAKNIYLEKQILFENKEDNDKKYIIEQPGMNKINIILGLNIPGIKNTITSIIQKFNNDLFESYMQNENLLRDNDLQENEIVTIKEKYNKALKIINESTYIEIDKNEYLFNIRGKDDNKEDNKEDNKYIKQELFDLFLDDFYTLFIDKNLNKNNTEKNIVIDYNSIKKILKLIINLRIKNDNKYNEDDVIKNTAYIINWVEAYSEELTIILDIFMKLNSIINNIYDLIEEIIKNNLIKYENSGRSQEYTTLVNNAIFLGIESLLKVVTSNENIYINLKNDPKKLSQLININKEILQQASKIQMSLSLYSKEAYSLQEFLILYDCLNANKLDNIENITKLIKFFSNETNLINTDKEEDLIKIFDEFYKFLDKLIGKDISFNDIMPIIFKNEYIKCTSYSFRNKIFQIILNKNEFIYKNNEIFRFVIRLNYDSPNDMKEYLTNLKGDIPILLKTLNDCKNEYLEQTIINIYEHNILSYFDYIPKLDFKDEDIKKLFIKYFTINNDTYIIFDLSFDILKECLTTLDSIYENDINDNNIPNINNDNKIQNENICKLFCIAYIKIYLSKLVNFIYYREQEIDDIKDIVKEIIGSNKDNKVRKILKIYIFKLFYNLMNKDWEQLINYNYENKKISFFKFLKEENELENLYLFQYLLPSDPKEYENYKKNFNEYLNKDKEECIKLFLEFLKKPGLDAFLIVSINQIISKLELNGYVNEEYTKLSNICDSLLPKYKCNDNLKQLLKLFFNEKQYKDVFKPKFDDDKNQKIIIGNIYESLLYGLRFCAKSLTKQNLLYSSIISKDCLNEINKSFIPGNYPLNNDNEDKIKNKLGINFVHKDIALLVHKKVRNLGEISFRLLNFILYNHLYFANCLNYYPNEQFKNDLSLVEMNCLDIIQANWNLLDEALRKRNIISIQIFMNLIFDKISEEIKNCKLITEEKELNKFEDKIDKIVESCINEYPNYSKKYLEMNKKLVPFKKENIRAIISELEPPIEEIYPHKDYPFLKYFIYTKYRGIDDLKKELGPKEDYMNKNPLLFKYISEYNIENSDVKKLEYLPAFNIFSNLMIDFYSFNISRKDAQSRSLSECQETIKRDIKEFDNIFEQFLKSWGKIKNNAIKYKSNKKMKVKELSKDDQLAYFLNDINENDYGMYIAAGYDNFIKWQNDFLEPIIKNGKNNKSLYYYIKILEKKIPIQEANKNQILQIENCFNTSDLYNFEDLVNAFSRRNIFGKDGKIDYLNYNSFIYDISSIEEELGKLILPGKSLFQEEDNLNFVSYWGEGFNGGKSEIFQKFYAKYKQKDLEDNEKDIIVNYIRDKKRNQENYDFKPFFGSMQLIIFYLTNNNLNEKDTINTILSNAPDYLRIDDSCKEFFKQNENNFKAEKLMNIFFLFEHICFEDLCINLPEIYKQTINEEIKNKIKEKLVNNEIKNGQFTIAEFGAALRRFISRSLLGKKSNIDPKALLSVNLNRPDLWGEKLGKLNTLGDLISDLINEFNLVVEQSYEFYMIIKDKDEKEIEIYKENIKDNKNNNNFEAGVKKPKQPHKNKRKI